MQLFSKHIATFIFVFVLVSDTFCQSKNSFGQWNISTSKISGSDLSWTNFLWTNDSLGNRYFERTAMFIPAKMEGLPNTFLFQFDLGADITRLYGNPLKTIFLNYPEFDRIRRYKGFWQFWNTQTAFKDLTLSFGDVTATTKNCYVMSGFGKRIATDLSTDSSPIKIGTIGADLFQNKILVLDYPNQRFAICDTLPGSLQTSFVNMSLDQHGRIIISLQLKNKSYRVLFDNGSSIFPLVASADIANSFSTAAGTDTIAMSSWGTIHNVIGRPIGELFQLAGQTYSDIMIYTDYRKGANLNSYDLIAGNVLFWDKVVIIDFKNKKFGMK